MNRNMLQKSVAVAKWHYSVDVNLNKIKPNEAYHYNSPQMTPKTYWEYRQTHLLIWRRVIVHEKDSIRMPEISTEILQPYTLDCPSAKSVIKARNRLLLGSLSTMSQEVYSSCVEHSCFLIFIAARILPLVFSYRSIRTTSDSGGKLSPRHCISWISVNPWKDLDDSPIKSERMKCNVILKSNWEILAPKD